MRGVGGWRCLICGVEEREAGGMKEISFGVPQVGKEEVTGWGGEDREREEDRDGGSR